MHIQKLDLRGRGVPQRLLHKILRLCMLPPCSGREAALPRTRIAAYVPPMGGLTSCSVTATGRHVSSFQRACTSIPPEIKHDYANKGRCRLLFSACPTHRAPPPNRIRCHAGPACWLTCTRLLQGLITSQLPLHGRRGARSAACAWSFPRSSIYSSACPHYRSACTPPPHPLVSGPGPPWPPPP
jgi:hypothetical protein